MKARKHNCKGFTLVEISVVLLIVGILVAGALDGLGAFQRVKYHAESQENLSNIKQQLLKFVLINKYLPCPDSDNDGLENRVSGVLGAECSVDVGGIPYIDLGVKEEDSLDGWHNPIRYAINRNATVTDDICDSTESASYFCNDLSLTNGRAFFSLDTPPTYNNAGDGNYFVCNELAASCSGAPVDSDLLTNVATIVLVAYGESGCSSVVGASAENCDTDQYYQQAAISSESGSEFDDLIEYITGYEIKTTVLSPVTVWKKYFTCRHSQSDLP
ncbi:hypothetical protein THIOSC15_3030006 [uncultured Thiomicrorhabdus sp.]